MVSYTTCGSGVGKGAVQPFGETSDNLPKDLKKIQISMPFNLLIRLLGL